MAEMLLTSIGGVLHLLQVLTFAASCSWSWVRRSVKQNWRPPTPLNPGVENTYIKSYVNSCRTWDATCPLTIWLWNINPEIYREGRYIGYKSHSNHTLTHAHTHTTLVFLRKVRPTIFSTNFCLLRCSHRARILCMWDIVRLHAVTWCKCILEVF